MGIIINSVNDCRVCKSPVKIVANFGDIYVNDFPARSGEHRGQAPMVLQQCTECDLVQMKDTVDPQILYGDHYWYESGLNPKLKQNLLDIAGYVNEHTSPGDVVLDIGANDGTLLSGIETGRFRIGCEPASNLWDKLAPHCDEMIKTMFSHLQIESDIAIHKASAITAIGMFYDMDDPNEFIHSVEKCLADDGIFIAQLMTLAPMLEMNDLGNVCHEHLEYYSYKSLVALYERNGLEIFDLYFNDIQGGSYQIWARKYRTGSIEHTEDISSIHDFYDSVITRGMQLRAELTQFTNAGKKVYVYGASTKGNTMLQLWDIGNYFEGAAEIHPDKIGRFTVGTNIPIVSEQEARENADVFFVPNFGFRDMFVEKEREWLEKGGRMIFAMPRVEVI